jgi:hypothetical protein
MKKVAIRTPKEVAEQQLTAAERETTIRTDEETNSWIYETFSRKMMTKMERIGAVPITVHYSKKGKILGAKYELDFKQVSFRSKSKGKRVMSEEQRQAASDRIKNLHRNKNKE